MSIPTGSPSIAGRNPSSCVSAIECSRRWGDQPQSEDGFWTLWKTCRGLGIEETELLEYLEEGFAGAVEGFTSLDLLETHTS